MPANCVERVRDGVGIVHGLAFIAVGVVIALLVEGAEREPAMLVALLVFLTAF